MYAVGSCLLLLLCVVASFGQPICPVVVSLVYSFGIWSLVFACRWVLHQVHSCGPLWILAFGRAFSAKSDSLGRGY